MVKGSRDEAREVVRSVSKRTPDLPDIGAQTINLGDRTLFVKSR